MKLLPCPFCGGEPEEDGGMFFEFYGHERQDHSITCKKCGAEVRCDVGEHEGADAPCSCHHDTRKICAEKWNRRAAMLQGADGKPELTVWYGAMPESNGKANWTAILHRKGEGRCMNGFTIDRSEYPGRVLYAADRVRYLIGEKSERPRILDYDADAHSGYVKPGNSPVIPDGWVILPADPTQAMMNAWLSEVANWRGHASGYRAMIAAAPKPEA
ncbi:Lar family restriction alleviation protein [Enterobacter roggenkampii]|uniref:Lar family restriction alleviation protein n=1 Tax=Enterobacter roggenkampii TaxID=1812935 RepID=UPI0020058318|nr:Lar family restriction alleviation protein [Enterobacter roggenkampii]MCK6839834.1 Lar family restriction alleviation protein [Enterobacter roggenkampii]